MSYILSESCLSFFLLFTKKMKPKEEVFSRSQGKETKKTLSRLGEASTSELKVVASSEDKMVICPDDKVVIRIYLVPSRYKEYFK